MNEIADDLEGDLIGDIAKAVIAELEEHLARHAEFERLYPSTDA